jgi:hypothetical protein
VLSHSICRTRRLIVLLFAVTSLAPATGSSAMGATLSGMVEGDATVAVPFAGNGEEELEDTEAPVLADFILLPDEIHVSSINQSIKVIAYVNDNLSGVSSVGVAISSPDQKQGISAALTRVGGSDNEAIFRGTLTFPRFAASGKWNITEVSLRDNVNNYRPIGPAELQEAGFPSSVEVNGTEDIEAPVLTDLTLTPSEVDVSSADQPVEVTAHVSDNISGVSYVGVAAASPDQKQGISTTLTRVGGSDNEAVFAGTLTFHQFAAAGEWKITEVSLRDNANNYQPVDSAELQKMGLPNSIQVSGAEDIEPPVLTDFDLTPTEVDVRSEDQLVEVTAHVSDNISGVSYVGVAAASPDQKQGISTTLTRVGGSDNEAVFAGTLTFHQFAASGKWNITEVSLRDNVNNYRPVGPAELQEAGLPYSVEVNGEIEPDTTMPQLLGLSIEPAQIDTSAEAQTVKLIAHIVDPSSVNKMVFSFDSPSGEATVSGGQFFGISGTALDGFYEIPVTFPQGSEPGEWNISAVQLRDKNMNEGEMPRAELEEAGLPHTVLVKSEAPVVSGISPSSGSEAGGTEVQISGSGFAGASEVRFGSAPATGFSVNSPDTIIAVAPAGTGSVDVTVTTPGGSSQVGAADLFTYGPSVSLTSTPNPSVHGQKVTFSAKVEPQAGGAPAPLGTVAFVEGEATLAVANLKKGTATYSTSALGSGKHAVTAVYSGDSYFASSSSETLAQTVGKASTEVVLTSSLNPAPFGSAATLKANVKAVAPGAGTPAGTVTFREGETVLATVQLSGATASYSLKALPPGEHAVTAAYSGDANDEASKSEPLLQAVVRATTTTSLTSSLNPAPSGAAGNLTVTVDAPAPSVATPIGSAVFREGEAVLADVPLSNGIARLPLKSLAPGTHQIVVSYAGGSNFEPSAGEITQVVVKADTETTLTSSLNPAPYGSSATLKATVKAVAPGTGTPTGTAIFREGETVLAAVPLSSGTAKYALKTTAPGNHPITVSYSGDGDFEASAAEITQTVSKAATTLTLTSSKNPAPLGSTGSLKATVKAVAPGTGQPPGTVTFREGETVLAVVPLSSGSAGYPLKSLLGGTHDITATYEESANYLSSKGAIVQVISP